jgi:hypothetical protein
LRATSSRKCSKKVFVALLLFVASLMRTCNALGFKGHLVGKHRH